MIEQGLVMRINGDAGVLAIQKTPGGFSGVPKDDALPTWTYRWVSLKPQLGLQSPTGLTLDLVQIDVYAAQKADVITLSQAIKHALMGFQGALGDPDATRVDSIFLADQHDPEEDAASRSWRRVLEFRLNYYMQA